MTFRLAVFNVIGMVGLVGLVYVQTARASAIIDNSTPEDPASLDASSGTSDPSGWTDAAAQTADQINPVAVMQSNNIAQDQANTNCDAFLQMIAVSEGTDRAADSYAVCYGYRHTVQSFSDHPAVTREWLGEPLDNLGAKYKGMVSTAAGRYQIIRPTWLGCKAALALPDFSPDSQDKAALYIIAQAHALDLVKVGHFAEAVHACRKQWASLPGADAPGQRMRSLETLQAAYVSAGGALA